MVSKSNKEQTRKLLNMKETILIKKSEAAKDIEVYGNLFSVLQEYESLSKSELDVNEKFDSKAIATLSNENIRKRLIENVKDEWHAKECYIASGEKIRCQLCHRPNKKIYYISNRHNELNVGSDCIKQFSGIENLRIVNQDFNKKEKLKMQEIRRVEFAELEVDDPEFL